ncbi:Tat pathway signal protein [Streptomyces griseoviridis]
MSVATFCPPTGRTRATTPAAVLVALVSLLASLLALTGAGPAAAADTECAPLALAPFGDPGGAVGTANLPSEGSACFTVRIEEAGLHLVSVGPRSIVHAQMYASDGTEVDCYDETFSEGGRCQVPEAGTYTVKVVNGQWSDTDATVTVVPLAQATRGCFERTGTGWDLPAVSRTSTGPLEVDCQPFEGEPGELVRLTNGTKVYGGMTAWITDASGARICPHFPPDDQDSLSCVLPGTGPYRVISQVSNAEGGFPAAYAVTVRSLSAPRGCRPTSVRPFGTLDGLDFGPVPCFTFTASRTGPHLVQQVDDYSAAPVLVFDADGRIACREYDLCRLSAGGTYTAVLGRGTYPFEEYDDDLVVLDRASGAGCVSAGTGLFRGELSAVGEYDCVELNAPEGARIAALTPINASGVVAAPEVVDATGAQQCGATELAAGECALTGTAPFRLLVHSKSEGARAIGAYALALHRTDAANDCPVLPSGSFTADGAKAVFGTDADTFSRCFSIPADAHSGAEVLQLAATSGGVPAKFSVLDATGKRVCDRAATTNGWTLCDLTPSLAHTVLVTGRAQAAGYTLARRDVTRTASSAGCARTAATTVGGPSLAAPAGEPGTLTCHQVTAAATDVVHVDVRDALGTANLAVFGAEGDAECSFANRSCAVTGSTTHQVLVQTPATLKAAPEYHLDALRIADADGPAAECVRVPSVAYGYGPVTGTLDERHSAVCAVLPTAGFDRFAAEITDTSGATTTAVPALYNSRWSNGCTQSTSGALCAAGGSSSAAEPTLFLLGLPEKASSTAYSARLTCQSTLCGTEKAAVTAVSPATGVAGTKVKLTVTGTALGPDAQVRLRQSGRTLTAVTDSVAADNRSVTATLDLTDVAAGGWDVSVSTRCCEYQRGGFTVTRPGLTTTALGKPTKAAVK